MKQNRLLKSTRTEDLSAATVNLLITREATVQSTVIAQQKLESVKENSLVVAELSR